MLQDVQEEGALAEILSGVSSFEHGGHVVDAVPANSLRGVL